MFLLFFRSIFSLSPIAHLVFVYIHWSAFYFATIHFLGDKISFLISPFLAVNLCHAFFSVSVLICWICIVRSTASGKWLSFPGETTYILNSHILWMSQLSQCCLFQSWHVCSSLSSGIWLCFWHFLLLLRSMHPQIPKFKREKVDRQTWSRSSIFGLYLHLRQCCRLSAKTLLTECAPNILLSAGYWMTFLDV